MKSGIINQRWRALELVEWELKIDEKVQKNPICLVVSLSLKVVSLDSGYKMLLNILSPVADIQVPYLNILCLVYSTSWPRSRGEARPD